jgi:hypothetical protein
MEVVTPSKGPSLHLILQRSFQPDPQASAKLNLHHYPSSKKNRLRSLTLLPYLPTPISKAPKKTAFTKDLAPPTPDLKV